MGHDQHSRRILAVLTLVTLFVVGSAASALGTPGRNSSRTHRTPDGMYVLTGTGLAEEGPAPPAAGPFGTVPGNAFSSFSTGTVFYTEALLAGKQRGTDVELAHASSAFSSAAVPERNDELGRLVAPALAPGDGFGRGSALDLAFRQEGFEDVVPQLDDKAEAKAPPTEAPVVREVQKIDANPFVDAQALRAEAAARSVSSGCVLGSDLAFGLANSTNAKLLKQGSQDDPLLAGRAPQPPRGTSQSTARTRLVPAATPGTFGLMSEVRETVAPITVLDGERQLTIEVAGEWVLQAVADGQGGKLLFGPQRDPDDQRPILRVIDSHGKVLNEVTLEDYAGSEGLDLEIEGVIHINLGEDPRAVAGPAESHPVASGTLTAGAADILRVSQVDPTDDEHFRQLRIGHMEAAVTVPQGGLACPGIGVKKELDKRSVKPGDSFTTAITVSNPNDCILDGVKLSDAVTTSPGVKWTGHNVTDGVFVVDGIGPLGPGESKEVRLDIDVDPTSLPGTFSDIAAAEGVCGRDEGTGKTTGGGAPPVKLRGSTQLEGPRVDSIPPSDAALPLESASPPPASSPGGATPAKPVTASSKRVATSRAPKAGVAARVPSEATRSAAPAGAAAPASTLVRSGGLVGAGLSLSLMAGGAALRMATRRRGRR